MAKKNLFQKIKDWFTGNSGGGKSSSANSRSSSNSNGSARAQNDRAYQAYQAQQEKRKAEEKKRKEAEQRLREQRAQSYIPSAQSYKSMANGNKPQNLNNFTSQKTVAQAKLDNAVQNPKPKKEKFQYTGLDGKKTKYSKLALNINESAEHEAKSMPRLYKFSEGLLSGTTLGVSDLLQKKATKGETKKYLNDAEKAAVDKLGKKKAAAYEMGGSLVGGAVTMGGAEGLALKGAVKAMPKLTAKTSASVASKLAAKEGVQKLATKQAIKAIAKEGGKEISEAEVKAVAKGIAEQYAKKATHEIGKNIAGDLTAGLAYDVNTSLADSKNGKDFAKNMAVNAGLAVGMGALGNVVANRSAVKEFLKNKGVSNEVADAVLKKVLKDRDVLTIDDQKEIGKQLGFDLDLPALKNTDNAINGVKNEPPTAKLDVSPKAAGETTKLDIGNGSKSFDTEQKLTPPTKSVANEKAPLKTEINSNDSRMHKSKALVPASPAKRKELGYNLVIEDASPRKPLTSESGHAKYVDLLALDRSAEGKRYRAKTEWTNSEPSDIDIKVDLTESPKVKEVSNKSANVSENALKDYPNLSKKVKATAHAKSEMDVNIDKDTGKLFREAMRRGENSKAMKQINARGLSDKFDDYVKSYGMNYKEQEELMLDSEIFQNARYKKSSANLDDLAEGTAYSRSTATDTAFGSSTKEEKAIINDNIENKTKDVVLEIKEANGEHFKSDGAFYKKERVYENAEKAVRKVSSMNEKQLEELYSEFVSLLDSPDEMSLKKLYEVTALKQMFNDGSRPEITQTCASLQAMFASMSGQNLAAYKHIMSLDPEYREKVIIDRAMRVCAKLGGVDNADVMAHLEKVAQTEYGQSFEVLCKTFANMSDKKMLAEQTEMLMNNIVQYAPPNLWNVIRNWRYMSLLGKPSTQITNFLGNLGAQAVNVGDNAFRKAFERLFAKYGAEQTADFLQMKDRVVLSDSDNAISKKINGLLHEASEWQFGDANSKYTANMKLEGQKFRADSDSYIQKTQERLAKFSKGVGKIGELEAKMLNACDRMFYERTYKTSMARYLKANGVKLSSASLEDIPESLWRDANIHAMGEAERLTYKQTDAFIDAITRLQDKGYSKNATLKQRVGALAVDSQMPFVKVSVNMAKQSYWHSPLGLIHGIGEVSTAIRKGDKEALNRGVQHLSMGSNGTILTIIGGVCAANTLDDDSIGFVGSLDGDSVSQKYQQNAGAITGAFKIGDMYFDISGLQPASGTFLTGALMGKALRQIGDEGLTVEKMWDFASAPFQVLVESSFLENIKNLSQTLGNGGGSGVTAAMVGNLAQQMIPTPIRGVARATVDSDVDTSSYADGNVKKQFDKQLNVLKASIPVLANTLPKKINAMGEEVRISKQGYNGKSNLSLALLKNQIDPFRTRKVSYGEGEKNILQLREQIISDARRQGKEVDSKSLPKLPSVLSSNKVSVGRGGGAGKEEFTLSGKQTEQAKRAQASASKLPDKLIDNAVFGAGNGSRANYVRANMPTNYADALNWVMNQPEYKSASKERKVEIINLMTDSKIRTYDAQKYVYTKVEGHTEEEFKFKQDLPEALQAKFNKNKAELNKLGITESDMVKVYEQGYTYHDSKNGKWYRDMKKADVQKWLADNYPADKASAIFGAIKQSNWKDWDGVTLSSGKGKKGRSSGGRSSGSSGSSSTQKLKLTTTNIKASDYKPTTQSYKSMAKSKGSSKVFNDGMKIKSKLPLELKGK